MIDQKIIDKILDAVNIVDVISNYVTLSKRGVNFWGICPFHADRSPSMSVSPSKQIFKCFSCGESGNVITFLQKHENLSYPEAIRALGKIAHIEVPDKELTPEELQRATLKESLTIALNVASEKFTGYLRNNPDAQIYLKSRGWVCGQESILDLYQVGFAPDSWRSLLDDMKASAYSSDVLLQTGLAVKGEKSTYDAFRGRIMFPYFDLKGSVIGFTGRSVKSDDKVKYYNTGETPVFHKGNAIYGLYQARQSIGLQDRVYFVEGQFDVLSFARAGIRNTVCGSGTTLTAEQIRMIMRFTNNVTLIYDQDEAGIKASVKNIRALIEAGANVRAIMLPEGEDPDSFAQKMDEKNLLVYLNNHEADWVTYLASVFKKDFEDPILKNEHFTATAELISNVQNKSLRELYITKLSELFKTKTEDAVSLIKSLKKNTPEEHHAVAGFQGVDELENTLEDISENCYLTDNFSLFSELYGENPVIYIKGLPTKDQIQELRRHVAYINVDNGNSISFTERSESDLLIALCEMHKAGFTIYVNHDDVDYDFVAFYIKLYANNILDLPGNIRTIYYSRCAEVMAAAPDAAQAVMEKEWYSVLKLTSKAFKELMKPYRDKKKSRNAMLSQQSFDDSLIYEDPDGVPDYVEENEEYRVTYRRHGYYPLLNKEKEPVGYMFKNPSGGGHIQVGDFYMTPLLHIYSNDAEGNKKIIKINRRFYKKPLYMEMRSKIFASLNSFEETLVNEEGVNFENGTVNHFKKIRQAMSYAYTLCDEIKTYGQQPENFYAFSNAIYHEVEGKHQIDMVSDIGVVTHNGKNYYAPAFSTIHAGLRKDDDQYEHLRAFIYKSIPIEQQCTFERWADLMNRVYPINENGKWSVLYAVMCAFRSEIHPIDRLFTALFFMGPTMSGKTQIAVSLRSLFIDPDHPCFNLNTGTDAALISLMEGFRDVPVVLEEYNNKDISDNKFQALKSITYDGDGKQKRKGTTGKDIETSKVLTPVVILGQETPQRDDNALMNRVVICEVPKRTSAYTEDESRLFQELKAVEKTGLSNILIQVLELRPIVRTHFKKYMRTINKELTREIVAGNGASGDMTRIINTITLFLSMCKLLEDHAPHMKLPFTYAEFFQIAKRKVITQVEMISRTDKLAGFFKSMEVMINTKSIIEGRDFDIDQPDKLTVLMPGKVTEELPIPCGTKVLYLRLSNIHTLYSKSSYNTEDATQSTIEANIRSNPAYLGVVKSHRFKWKEVKEVPKGEFKNDGSIGNEMIRVMDTKTQNTSCIAMNYEVFRQYFDIDLERSSEEEDQEPEVTKGKTQDIPF